MSLASELTYQLHHEELLNTLDKDMIVGLHNRKKLYLSEVIHFIFGNRIAIMPSKGSNSAVYRDLSVIPGWIHLAADKENLRTQKDSVWIRSVSTLLNKVHSGYEYMTYGTFHLSPQRKHYERKKANLNSTNAIVIDIDSKSINYQEIVYICASYGFPMPSFINQTPNGYHVWFVFSPNSEAVGPHISKVGTETATGKFYNDVNKTLVKAFSEHFNINSKSVDPVYGGERYIRIPKNIIYWSGERHTLEDLGAFKKHYDYKNKAKKRNAVEVDNFKLINDPAFIKLKTQTPPEGQRRRTAFTISLACFDAGISKNECITELRNWYSTVCENKEMFTWKEVLDQVKSAYDGQYHVSPVWIKELTGLWPRVFFSKKKSKEERVYSTLEEHTNQFLNLLNDMGGIWVTTTRKAIEIMGMKSKKEYEKVINLLVKANTIKKKVIGKGRYAKTIYILNSKNREPKTTKNNLVFFPRNNAPLSYRNIMLGVVGGTGLRSTTGSDPP